MILSTSVVWHLMLDIYLKNICAGHLTSKNSKNVKYVNTAFKCWSGSSLTPSNSEDTRGYVMGPKKNFFWMHLSSLRCPSLRLSKSEK